jgi:TolA-binding protein
MGVDLSSGWTAVILAVIALISSGIGAWASTQASRRSARNEIQVENLRVDAEAYGRARASYDAALKEQEERIQRLHAEVDRLRAEVNGHYRP